MALLEDISNLKVKSDAIWSGMVVVRIELKLLGSFPLGVRVARLAKPLMVFPMLFMMAQPQRARH